MLDLYAELRGVLQALEAAGVHEYAIVGGLAVSIYTTPRATEDIDLLVPAAALDAALQAVAPLGFILVSRALPVAGGRLTVQRVTKVDGTDALPIDFIAPVDPTLGELLGRRERMTLEGADVWVIGIDALRMLKQLRGSPQDVADLEALGPGEP